MGVKQKSKSLHAQGHQLSESFIQIQVIQDLERLQADFEPFRSKIAQDGYDQLKPSTINTFQLNIGKLCNQSCAHCHVDAGPDRKTENMSRELLEQCLAIIALDNFTTVDITGGAPEMNPNFRWFVEECSKMNKQVMNRCNLTIIMANKKYADLPDFFAKHQVHIVSSLPSFSKSRTDAQRGDGVFEDSIAALKKLNAVGYGMPNSGLKLDLVYNPSGAFLPGDQAQLQQEFKRQLARKYDIQFNELYAITNLPISRFLDYLLESNNYSGYMQQLLDAYNPNVIDGLMCRNTLSISWDGFIHDCDFNQMLDLKINNKHQHISNFNLESILQRDILVGNHCYGCTAGAGSSCGGEIA